jgi:AraC family transcriptional regulator
MDSFLTVWAVVTFVESRVHTGIRYDELCGAAGFSLPHLREIFARTTGQPLARYILSRRIARAAADALNGGESWLAIAGRYGFRNPDTFTRAFRRVTGWTPSEFRRERPKLNRVKLCAGVFGVPVPRKGSSL